MKEHLVFVDTESQGVDLIDPKLISIGLIDQDGAEFYREVKMTAGLRAGCVPWVLENVFPHLQAGEVAKAFDQIGRDLHAWLAALAPGNKVLLVTDSPMMDARHVHALLTAASGPPANVKPGVWLIPWPSPIQPCVVLVQHRPGHRAHHALDDARANREAWLEAQRAIEEELGKEKRS